MRLEKWAKTKNFAKSCSGKGYSTFLRNYFFKLKVYIYICVLSLHTMVTSNTFSKLSFWRVKFGKCEIKRLLKYAFFNIALTKKFICGLKNRHRKVGFCIMKNSVRLKKTSYKQRKTIIHVSYEVIVNSGENLAQKV